MVDKDFPHSAYGESKDLKAKSFPLTFKHHFFKAYRLLNKVDHTVSDNKVGFWAPAGNPVSKNKKVMVESKLKKEKDVWDTRDKYCEVTLGKEFGKEKSTKRKR